MEKTTIMQVVDKTSCADAIQNALEDVGEMEGIAICYIRKDGEPVTIWAGISGLSTLGLFDLCRNLVIRAMHRSQEEKKNDEE